MIKSTYKVNRETNNTDSGSCSNFLPNIYSELWNLNIPSYLNLFLWKLIKDLQPTAHNHIYYHKTIDVNCTFCHMEPGTIEHLFFRMSLDG